MARRLRSEEGWTVVTAVMVMMIMMSFGLAAYATVDTQTGESKKERNRESSFNLTEGALQQQGYVLGFNWPATAPGYTDCSFGTGTNVTPALQCPQPANLVGGNFSQVDFDAGASWTTVVRDNRIGGAVPQNSDFYDSTVHTTPCMGTTTVPCRWDANADDKLWVSATATVRGKTRKLVALLKRERLSEAFPRVTLKSDHFNTSNNGNKLIIDSTGAQIVTRCQAVQTTQPPGTENLCENYELSKGQVAPAGSIVREPAQTAPTMDDAQLARFQIAARTSNPATYYTSCPSSLAGPVVYIDVPAGTVCSFSSSPIWNSAVAPGLVIMPRGRIEFTGGPTFYGVLYLANKDNYTGNVLDIGGNAEVIGGVIIDSGGGVNVGSSGGGGLNGANLTFSGNAFNALATFGTAGLIQNTWRELPPNTN